MIGRIYRWLFDAHVHQWQILRSEPYERFRYYKDEKIPTGNGTLHALHCVKCGLIRGVEVGVKGD